jgi:hypothetical protein
MVRGMGGAWHRVTTIPRARSATPPLTHHPLFPCTHTHTRKHTPGLPEHASSFRLKTTRGASAAYSEPYRLYNLDVFEYELDEPMALYGSIPFVASHTPAGTTGALFFNPCETFVDVQALVCAVLWVLVCVWVLVWVEGVAFKSLTAVASSPIHDPLYYSPRATRRTG